VDSAEAKASQGIPQGKFLSAEGMSATVQQLLWAELWVEVFSLPSLLSVFKRNGGDDGTGIPRPLPRQGDNVEYLQRPFGQGRADRERAYRAGG
jgi:hypothetical protein